MAEYEMIYAIAAILLIIWNLAVFIAYGTDKRKAKQKKRRISEKSLILMAVFMGGAGALLGMYAFHHKTKHPKFTIGVPIALILNIAVCAFLLYFSTFMTR